MQMSLQISRAPNLLRNINHDLCTADKIEASNNLVKRV